MNSPDSFRSRSPAPRSGATLAALVLLAVLALIAVPAAAHAPSAIQLSYDDAKQLLSVTITHPVDDPQTHYIRNVQVKVNNLVPIDKDYKSQPSDGTFTYTYSLPLGTGDTVRVTATCVQGPSLTEVMKITSPTVAPSPAITGETTPLPPAATTTPVPVQAQTTQKSALGLLPVIGTVAFLLAKKH